MSDTEDRAGPEPEHDDAPAPLQAPPAVEPPPPADEPPPQLAQQELEQAQPPADQVATTTTKRKATSAVGSDPKRRWARKQAEELPTNKYQRAESQQGEYNIWYHRYLGDQHHVRERATNRCVPDRDSGLTRADATRPDTYVCLYFAKGCCVQGRNCNYLHRVPTPEDNDRLDMVHDVFGRKRHQTDREDMGGVGCFSKECKTLYIGNIPIESMVDTYKLLAKHFGTYGPVEQINVKPKHGCCFVRFLYRANAEFAKVAMAEQSLDGEEQLNIRWAYEDPNPRVIKQVQNEKEQRVVDALRQAGHTQEMARYNAPSNYRPPEPTQAAGPRAVDPHAYPNTMGQFSRPHPVPPPTAALPSSTPVMYAAGYPPYPPQYGAMYAGQYHQQPAPPQHPPQARTTPVAVDKHTPMTREMYMAQQRATDSSSGR